MKGLYRVAIYAFLLLGLSNPSFSGPPDSYILEGVPFYPQLDYYCGPASLASVINYWGGKVTQEEIGKRIFRKDLKGSLSMDLVLYARERGFRTEVIRGSVERLKEEIRKGRPVIAFLNVGFGWLPKWHYVVVFGYDEEKGEIIAHSGKEKGKRFGYSRFMEMWKATDYWALILIPERRD